MKRKKRREDDDGERVKEEVDGEGRGTVEVLVVGGRQGLTSSVRELRLVDADGVDRVDVSPRHRVTAGQRKRMMRHCRSSSDQTGRVSISDN